MNKESLGFLALTLSAAAEEYKEKLRGEKGDRGDKGEKGERGKDGKDGYTPRKGIDYRDGLPGRDGKDGLAGKDGLTPQISEDFIRQQVRFVFEAEVEKLKGPEGKAGPAGIPGMRMRGEWKQGEKYSEGDLVALGGDIWYADNSGPESRPGRGLKWKLFLRSQAGRLSGYGVVQGQGGGGSLAIGSAVSGGTPSSVLFINAAGNLAQLPMVANALLFSDGTDLTQSANLTFDGTKLTIANGTATGLDLGLGAAATPALSFGATNTGFYAPNTSFVETVIGGARILQVTNPRVSCIADNGGFTVNSSASAGIGGSASWPNAMIFAQGAGPFGQATSRTEINKTVTAFTDAVAKTVFTVDVPNAAHSASYLVRLTGSIGAGGAIGANEASATNCYVVTICRTAGVNAVATISAAFGAAASNVAGATTVTCAGTLAAVAGAVGALNTIAIQATITKAGGASDNHTCVATASLLNANASGITIA